jgi:hypothetical protein
MQGHVLTSIYIPIILWQQIHIMENIAVRLKQLPYFMISHIHGGPFVE